MIDRDPRFDPRAGDRLRMRWGGLAVVERRTDHMVWIRYEDGRLQRYGVPNAWVTELAVGSEVISVAVEFPAV